MATASTMPMLDAEHQPSPSSSSSDSPQVKSPWPLPNATVGDDEELRIDPHLTAPEVPVAIRITSPSSSSSAAAAASAAARYRPTPQHGDATTKRVEMAATTATARAVLVAPGAANSSSPVAPMRRSISVTPNTLKSRPAAAAAAAAAASSDRPLAHSLFALEALKQSRKRYLEWKSTLEFHFSWRLLGMSSSACALFGVCHWLIPSNFSGSPAVPILIAWIPFLVLTALIGVAWRRRVPLMAMHLLLRPHWARLTTFVDPRSFSALPPLTDSSGFVLRSRHWMRAIRLRFYPLDLHEVMDRAARKSLEREIEQLIALKSRTRVCTHDRSSSGQSRCSSDLCALCEFEADEELVSQRLQEDERLSELKHALSLSSTHWRYRYSQHQGVGHFYMLLAWWLGSLMVPIAMLFQVRQYDAGLIPVGFGQTPCAVERMRNSAGLQCNSFSSSVSITVLIMLTAVSVFMAISANAHPDLSTAKRLHSRLWSAFRRYPGAVLLRERALRFENDLLPLENSRMSHTSRVPQILMAFSYLSCSLLIYSNQQGAHAMSVMIGWPEFWLTLLLYSTISIIVTLNLWAFAVRDFLRVVVSALLRISYFTWLLEDGQLERVLSESITIERHAIPDPEGTLAFVAASETPMSHAFAASLSGNSSSSSAVDLEQVTGSGVPRSLYALRTWLEARSLVQDLDVNFPLSGASYVIGGCFLAMLLATAAFAVAMLMGLFVEHRTLMEVLSHNGYPAMMCITLLWFTGIALFATTRLLGVHTIYSAQRQRLDRLAIRLQAIEMSYFAVRVADDCAPVSPGGAATWGAASAGVEGMQAGDALSTPVDFTDDAVYNARPAGRLMSRMAASSAGSSSRVSGASRDKEADTRLSSTIESLKTHMDAYDDLPRVFGFAITPTFFNVLKSYVAAGAITASTSIIASMRERLFT